MSKPKENIGKPVYCEVRPAVCTCSNGGGCKFGKGGKK